MAPHVTATTESGLLLGVELALVGVAKTFDKLEESSAAMTDTPYRAYLYEGAARPPQSNICFSRAQHRDVFARAACGNCSRQFPRQLSTDDRLPTTVRYWHFSELGLIVGEVR
jgi:hypothetical protein